MWYYLSNMEVPGQDQMMDIVLGREFRVLKKNACVFGTGAET